MDGAYMVARIARCVGCDADQVLVAWIQGKDGKPFQICRGCVEKRREVAA